MNSEVIDVCVLYPTQWLKYVLLIDDNELEDRVLFLFLLCVAVFRRNGDDAIFVFIRPLIMSFKLFICSYAEKILIFFVFFCILCIFFFFFDFFVFLTILSCLKLLKPKYCSLFETEIVANVKRKELSKKETWMAKYSVYFFNQHFVSSLDFLFQFA